MSAIPYLLPNRPPFLMVEKNVEYEGGCTPRLYSEWSVLRSDPVFAYMKPPLLWPSLYVVEGLGQSCSLLSLLWQFEREYFSNVSDHGKPSTFVMNSRPASSKNTPELMQELMKQKISNAVTSMGMMASIDINVTGRVQAGDHLQYKVHQTRLFKNLARFNVKALVKSQIVAQGTIVGAQSDHF